MTTATRCLLVALAIVIAAPTNASAQSPDAEVLFREGQKLMKEKKYAEACEKFESAERIEPTFNTEFDLANCREKNGQTASAWAMFLKAISTGKKMGDKKRTDSARERVDLLKDKLVYLTIEVPTEVQLEDLVIKRNKAPVDRELWNTKVPVDPDEYIITAEAPGYRKWKQTINVQTKNKVIEVPELEKKAAPESDTSDDEADDTTTDDHVDDKHDHDTDTPPSGHGRRYRSSAIALAVMSGAAVVIGTSFALYSRKVESQSDMYCPNIQCTDPYGVDLNHTARLDAKIANISWGIGGAALVGSLVVWWVGRPTGNGGVAIAPVVGGDRAGFAIGGTF